MVYGKEKLYTSRKDLLDQLLCTRLNQGPLNVVIAKNVSTHLLLREYLQMPTCGCLVAASASAYRLSVDFHYHSFKGDEDVLGWLEYLMHLQSRHPLVSFSAHFWKCAHSNITLGRGAKMAKMWAIWTKCCFRGTLTGRIGFRRPSEDQCYEVHIAIGWQLNMYVHPSPWILIPLCNRKLDIMELANQIMRSNTRITRQLNCIQSCSPYISTDSTSFLRGEGGLGQGLRNCWLDLRLCRSRSHRITMVVR